MLICFQFKQLKQYNSYCIPYYMHAIYTTYALLWSIPTSLDQVDEKMTCVGSWETACVDRNWAGGEGGSLVGHASRVTIWPTCVTTATRLFRIFGIFETLGSAAYYSQVTMLLVLIGF